MCAVAARFSGHPKVCVVMAPIVIDVCETTMMMMMMMNDDDDDDLALIFIAPIPKVLVTR